jgi:small-conductance mechanosensitive channel
LLYFFFFLCRSFYEGFKLVCENRQQKAQEKRGQTTEDGEEREKKGERALHTLTLQREKQTALLSQHLNRKEIKTRNTLPRDEYR